MKLVFTIVAVLVLSLMAAVPVAAAPPQNPELGKPDFSEHIYADGYAWGTKIGPLLPAPNGHNNQSFDMLFLVQDEGANVQLPVGEAAPGNPEYSGGRWSVYVAEWDVAPHAVFTFYEEKDAYDIGGVDSQNLAAHIAAGHLTVSSAMFYFECPLLPVLE